MMDPILFVSVVILALTQLVKMALPEQVHGWITIIIAFVIGIFVALFDGFIGLTDISIAEGLVASLGAIGIATASSKAGGGAAGDENVVR